MSDSHGCEAVRSLLAELATGAAAGDERAWALEHVAGCARCRAELNELARVADALLLLAPRAEPSIGFESRVLAGFDQVAPASARPRRRERRGWVRRRWVRRAVPALAFVLVVLLALAGGARLQYARTADDLALADRYRQTLAVANGQYLKAAKILTANGSHAGTAFLYQGNPSWVLVTAWAAPADGPYEIVVIDRRGAAHRLGTCRMTEGSGTAGYRLHLRVRDVAQVRLTAPGDAGLAAVT